MPTREDLVMTCKVSEEDKRNYSEDGVICLRGVIDPALCAEMLEHSVNFLDHGSTEGYRKQDVQEGGGRYRVGSMMWRSDPAFRSFALQSELPSIAAQILNTQAVRLFYDQIFLIEPNTKTSSSWHNDLPFWPLKGEDIISLWVALTAVTPENSPLQYVAGSHRGTPYRPDNPSLTRPVDPSLEICPNFSDPANQGGLRILSWTLEPGDVLVHHPLAVHGAPPNVSKGSRRCGLSVRYLGKDVRYEPSEFTVLPLELDIEFGSYPLDDVLLPEICVAANA
jgi:ectoine hydroxylase-related dioxygenase (phytanoyl-CoA dioxygenase family)